MYTWGPHSLEGLGRMPTLPPHDQSYLRIAHDAILRPSWLYTQARDELLHLYREHNLPSSYLTIDERREWYRCWCGMLQGVPENMRRVRFLLLCKVVGWALLCYNRNVEASIVRIKQNRMTNSSNGKVSLSHAIDRGLQWLSYSCPMARANIVNPLHKISLATILHLFIGEHELG